MGIIKGAFVEGRETDISWDESNSKKLSVKAEVALENFSLMEKREFRSIIPLERICPDTGKVLEVYPSRLAAARWIVDNVLKRPDKNPISITGNMEMCIRLNYRAYGYYWRLVDKKSKVETSSGSAKKIFAINRFEMGSGNGVVYNSIREVAQAYDVSERVVRNRMNGIVSKLGDCYRLGVVQKYNPTKRTKTFKTIDEAVKALGISTSTVKKWVSSGRYINNIKYVVLKGRYTDKQYVVYKSNKKVGTYSTFSEVAKVVGLCRTSVSKRIKNNQSLGLYKVKVKY